MKSFYIYKKHYFNYHWRAIDDEILYARGLLGQLLYIDIPNQFIGIRLDEKASSVDCVDVFGVISKEKTNFALDK